MCCEVEAGNFTTFLHCVLLNVGKSVLKVTETLWKNSLIIGKGVWVIHENFVVIADTLSKKIGCSILLPTLEIMLTVAGNADKLYITRSDNFLQNCRGGAFQREIVDILDKQSA
jgi:NO-binding membrane sensor protein with MHYT domain